MADNTTPPLAFCFHDTSFCNDARVQSFFGGRIHDEWIVHKAPQIFEHELGMNPLILKNSDNSEVILVCLFNINKLGYADPEGAGVEVGLYDVERVLTSHTPTLFGNIEAFEMYTLITDKLAVWIPEKYLFIWAMRVYCYNCPFNQDFTMTDFCCHCSVPKCKSCMKTYPDGRSACGRCFAYLQ